MNVVISMDEQRRFLIGIGILSLFFAIVIAVRTKNDSEETGISLETNRTAVSNREIDNGDILTAASYRHQSGLPGIKTSSQISIADEVRAEIAKEGARATAETVRDDFSLQLPRRKARIEEVMRQWSRQNSEGAGSWIEEQLGAADSDESFNQAALSGYIESIALIDPEAAAEAAELLEENVLEARESDSSPAGDIVSADPGFPGDPDFLTPDRNK